MVSVGAGVEKLHDGDGNDALLFCVESSSLSYAPNIVLGGDRVTGGEAAGDIAIKFENVIGSATFANALNGNDAQIFWPTGA